MTTELPSWVASYVGIPFLDHGRELSGLDCYGLLYQVYHREFNIELPSYDASYRVAREADCAFEHELPTSGWVEVPRSTARLGDALLLRVRGLPLHVGVYLGAERFLHVAPSLGTVVDRADSPIWARRVLGVYRYTR